MNGSIPIDIASDDISLERFKRNRLSRSQFGLMVDFMTLNPEIVHGRSATKCSKEIWLKKWEELSALLNADGTGAKRCPEKWRKSWHDQKCLIKARAEKRDACKTITGSDAAYKLNDLEERVLKLINFRSTDVRKKMNTRNVTKNLNIQSVPQAISPTNYIVLSVGAANVPVLLESSNASSKLEPAVFVGLEPRNIAPADLESSSNTSKTVEETNSILLNSASTSDLNRSHNISNVQLSVETAAHSSELRTKEVQESKETEKSSSLIVKLKPCEDSENTEISSASEDNQEPVTVEKNEENNVMNYYIQNPSSNPPMKKFKVSHHSHFQRKNKFEIAKLLQRQNKLLEGIAGTLARIEKSVSDRSSLEVQRKNNMLVNISENIEKLAESLGTVSKSLKSIGDN